MRKPPEDYSYGSVVRVGQTLPVTYISGGPSWLPIPRNGLFEDLIQRVPAVMGLSPKEPSPLTLADLNEKVRHPVFSNTVVVHFAEQGMADIHLDYSARKLADEFNEPN